MALTREELFKQAAAQRKAAKVEEDQKKNFHLDLAHYTALEENVPKVVRLVGLPISARGDDHFSPKLMNYSQIVGDDGKKFRCIWPTKNERPDWILWKLYNKVMSGKWNQEKQIKVFDYQEKFPNLWKRVAKNDNVANAFEKGWKPQALVVANVLDRGTMQWHAENKKYSIFSKKVSDNNGTPWYEPGIPLYLYNMLFEEIVPVYGDWETYDIVIVKLGDKPYYTAWNAVDDQKKFLTLYPDMVFDKELSGRPLTEEELSWDKWDVDKPNQVTTATKIHNRLKIFFQQVDENLKTHFFDELCELVEKEKKELIEKNVSAGTSTPSEDEDDEGVDKKPEPTPAPVKVADKPKETPASTSKPVASTPASTLAPTTIRTVKAAPVTDHIKKMIEKGYTGLTKYSDTDKSYLIGYDEVKEKPIWKELQLFQCPKCHELGPQEVNICIKCGIEFGEQTE